MCYSIVIPPYNYQIIIPQPQPLFPRSSPLVRRPQRDARRPGVTTDASRPWEDPENLPGFSCKQKVRFYGGEYVWKQQKYRKMLVLWMFDGGEMWWICIWIYSTNKNRMVILIGSTLWVICYIAMENDPWSMIHLLWFYTANCYIYNIPILEGIGFYGESFSVPIP